MRQEVLGRGGPNYALCRYGMSRTLFRGPPRPLDGRYIAFFGGTETFGRFLRSPYPARVEARLGEVCVNFGAVNAGVELYRRDATLLAAAHDALATVIQLPGVQNQTNRFYQVHPRRNDRFLRASPALEVLYPDVDFTTIAFTRHLLSALESTCPQRFALVRSELQSQWSERLRALLERIAGVKVLLWLADHAPPLASAGQPVMAADPLFVTRDMVEGLRGQAEALVQVVPKPLPAAARTRGLDFHPLERPAAEQMLGAAAHEAAAEALAQALRPHLPATAA